MGASLLTLGWRKERASIARLILLHFQPKLTCLSHTAMVLKQTRYFLRSIAKKPAECPSDGHQPPLNEPISILSLPDTLNYEELVTQAESDLDGLEISVAEDLSTGAHAVTGAVEHQLLHPFPDPSSNSYFPPNNATPPRAEKVSYHHWKRKLKRKKKRDAEDTDCTEPSERTVDQAVRKSKVVRLDLDAATFDAAKGAHTAKRGTEKSMGAKGEIEKEYSVEELVEMGYTHIPWGGIDPLLILDCKGRIIAFLAGRPNRDDFVDEMMEVFEEMMAVSEEMGWNEETRAAHKRGWFHAFNRGVTMGMGSPTPVALSNGEGIDATLTRLAGSQGFKRLDGYQNSGSASLSSHYRV
ncbi:hypothetical protein L218DRAFT_520286 [Marasmius fiardii PR-910]|nr:hypothetical protein L218DRAFT_520286 [Marasmius fiardii PR-910]